MAIVSVPNRVFNISYLKEYRYGVFCIGTVTSMYKGRYDDFPLALTFVDIKAQLMERIPLLYDDFGLALNKRIEIKASGSTIKIETQPNTKDKYLISNPKNNLFSGISIELYEVTEPREQDGYDEQNRKTHTLLIKKNQAALSYLGSAAISSNNLVSNQWRFAVNMDNSKLKSGLFVKTTDAGRLFTLDFGSLNYSVRSIANSAVYAPHIFLDGSIACISGNVLNVINKQSQVKQISIPEQDANSIRRHTIGLNIFDEAEISKSPKPDYGLPRKLMFTESAVGYARGLSFFKFNLTSNGFEQLPTSTGAMAKLRELKDAEIVDWDLLSRTFVIQQWGSALPVYQRLAVDNGDFVGEGWDGGAKNRYGGIINSNVSGDWRAYSFLNDSTTGGYSYIIRLERLGDSRINLLIADLLPMLADPLALFVQGNHADVIYGAGDKVFLNTIDLSSGQVKQKWIWPCASRFGGALVDIQSGHLFIPNASGFEVWSIWQDKPAKRFDLFLGDGDQYAIILPNGAYTGSPGCESMLRIKADGGVVDGSSIAPWRNRPADVLKVIGGDPVQIEVLSKVTERWLKKLGNPERNPEPTAQDIPALTLANDIPLWAQSEQVNLKFSAKPGTAPVKDLVVRVNGVDQQRGANSMDGKSEIDRTMKLAQGQNWIEALAIDEKGRSSNLVRVRTILRETAKPIKRFIVAIGVSKYKNSNFNLEFAAKDATDISTAIKESTQGESEVLLLTNEEATKDAPDKIRKFLANATESDEVVAFCAGHGVLDSNLDYVYASHEFDPENPSETGIKLDDLVDAIGSSKSLKRLLLLDTCHSGQVGERDEMLLAQMNTDLPQGVRAVKQRGMSAKPVAGLSAEGKQRFIEEMFLLPGLHRGINIIGASGGSEFALESAQWNNGVFTATIIEAMRDKKADLNGDTRISVSELRDFLAQRVSELTKGAQKPSVVASERDQDFDLSKK